MSDYKSISQETNLRNFVYACTNAQYIIYVMYVVVLRCILVTDSSAVIPPSQKKSRMQSWYMHVVTDGRRNVGNTTQISV